MPEFSIHTQKLQNGIHYIQVSGFLDAHTFEEMERLIDNLFESGTFRLVVDLSKLDYISSAGAGVFIGAISRAQENSGNIILMRPSTNVKEVFDLLGLSQIFSFADTMEAAVRMFE